METIFGEDNIKRANGMKILRLSPALTKKGCVIKCRISGFEVLLSEYSPFDALSNVDIKAESEEQLKKRLLVQFMDEPEQFQRKLWLYMALKEFKEKGGACFWIDRLGSSFNCPICNQKIEYLAERDKRMEVYSLSDKNKKHLFFVDYDWGFKRHRCFADNPVRICKETCKMYANLDITGEIYRREEMPEEYIRAVAFELIKFEESDEAQKFFNNMQMLERWSERQRMYYVDKIKRLKKDFLAN